MGEFKNYIAEKHIAFLSRLKSKSISDLIQSHNKYIRYALKQLGEFKSITENRNKIIKTKDDFINLVHNTLYMINQLHYDVNRENITINQLNEIQSLCGEYQNVVEEMYSISTFFGNAKEIQDALNVLMRKNKEQPVPNLNGGDGHYGTSSGMLGALDAIRLLANARIDKIIRKRK